MAGQLRCDICDAKESKWHFRKRINIFTIVDRCCSDGNYACVEPLDICDECMEDFKEFVELKKKGGSDGTS